VGTDIIDGDRHNRWGQKSESKKKIQEPDGWVGGLDIIDGDRHNRGGQKSESKKKSRRRMVGLVKRNFITHSGHSLD